MTPDQAEFLLTQVYLPQLQNERKTTRRVIEAIPLDQSGYRPDPKSKTALELAWHLASSECFFLNAVAAGKFERGDGSMPESIRTSADVLKWYDENSAKATAAVSSLKGDALARNIEFAGMFNFPAVSYLGFQNNHSIHHRGQLAVYLRPMGAKVPGIYGPSADEPMQLPATTNN
jgi:uncharacterized damage-inducible protein DinB